MEIDEKIWLDSILSTGCFESDVNPKDFIVGYYIVFGNIPFTPKERTKFQQQKKQQ